MEPLAAVAALVAALLGGGGVGAILGSRSKNRATDTDTVIKVFEAAQKISEKITDELQEEVARVIERERECRAEVRSLHAEVGELQRLQRVTQAHLERLDQEGS